MTYMCPFCQFQQAERTLCKRCGFHLASNHFNPVCSKCKIKYPSMEELKLHFNSCTFLSDVTLPYFKRCLECKMNFYSEAMFNIHNSEVHNIGKGEVCKVCTVGKISDDKCSVCPYSIESSTQPNNKNLTLQTQPKSSGKVNLFQCKQCSKVFTQCLTYQNHIESKSCENEQLTCSKCKMKFANKSTKDKHVSQNACGNEKYAKCFFENCNVRCMKRIQLVKHLKTSHDLHVKYDTKKFPSFRDFELWKDDFGIRTMTFYSIMARSKHITSDNEEIESISYGCSFDFQRATSLKHKLSTRPNKKRKVRFDMNDSSVCISRINVKITGDNQVIARICPDHNHPLSIEHLKVQKLPKIRREFLSNAFVMGASIEEVMNLLQQESKELNLVTKESTLPRRFLKEVQRKSVLRHSNTNDMQAVAQFVDNLKRKNGVLLYKAGSDTFNTEEELPPDIFMLGIQTENMLEVLETYNDVLYVEGLHYLAAYSDQRLFNILVTDETGTAFPVAHFITNATSEDHITLMFASLKPRVKKCKVQSIVVQGDTNLDKALAPVFNSKTMFINQWDLSSMDCPMKKQRESQKIEFSVLVDTDDKEEIANDKMCPNQLQRITEQTVAAADDCVLQFHKNMRMKFKRSHSMFILLTELMAYFKKRYSYKFNVTIDEEKNMPEFLKQMRQQLFDYQILDSQSQEEDNILDEMEDILSNSDNECDGLSCLIQSETIDELSDDSLCEFASDSEDNTEPNDNKDILKEIVGNPAASTEDESSLHLLREYQKSITQLLEKHVLARPLIMKSVLEDTRSIYEQVLACCNETSLL